MHSIIKTLYNYANIKSDALLPILYLSLQTYILKYEGLVKMKEFAYKHCFSVLCRTLNFSAVSQHITIMITILFKVKIPQCVQLTLHLKYCKKNI